MNPRTWAPVATFAVVAAVGTTAALVHDSAGRSGPPPLGLTSGYGQDAARSAGSTADGYRLTGTLSDEEPADAPVWELAKGPAAADDVQRLATALHAGDPVLDGTTWRAGGLVVSGDGGQAWSWTSCPGTAPDAPTTSGAPTTISACASGSGSSGVATTPLAAPSPVPAVAASVVEDAARPVLAALGADVDDATIDTSPYGGSATVDPEVGGLQVVGMTTRVDVDGEGHVTGAGGYLGTARSADSYPLLSAKDAFDAMPAYAHPDICQLPPDGSSGCVEPEPVQITGATLGLSLQPAKDGNLLVPSWLYATSGGQPIAVVAVEQRFQQPEDQPVDTPASADPGTVDPAPPTASRWPVIVQSAKPGTGSTLVVTYDNGGCGQANVTGSAKEDATTVYVVLEADARPEEMACTDDYRPATITVELQAPLGKRTLVDGSSSQPVERG